MNPGQRKGDGPMGGRKKKRRRRKPTAQPSGMKQLAADILAGVVSGLILLAIQRLLKW